MVYTKYVLILVVGVSLSCQLGHCPQKAAAVRSAKMKMIGAANGVKLVLSSEEKGVTSRENMKNISI